jgi:hypothetical protein
MRAKARLRGATLLELSLAIVVGLGLLVGGIVYFSKTDLDQKLSETNVMLASVAPTVAAIARGDYADVGTGSLVAQDVFPATMLAPDGALRHPFGGAMSAGSDAPHDRFWIELSDLPELGCRRIPDLGQGGLETLEGRLTGVEINGSFFSLENGLPDRSGCLRESNVVRVEFR